MRSSVIFILFTGLFTALLGAISIETIAIAKDETAMAYFGSGSFFFRYPDLAYPFYILVGAAEGFVRGVGIALCLVLFCTLVECAVDIWRDWSQVHRAV
jgi:hypothetical protein